MQVDFSHGGNIYELNKKVIDFSANINPLGLAPGIKKAMYNNFESILHYPRPYAGRLGRKIAQYWGIDKENVLLGNGSAELIYLVMSCFRPKTTLIPVPTFSEYERAAKSVPSKVRFIILKQREGFRLHLSQLRGADIVFVSNPNNPTGNLMLNPAALPSAKLLVIDEAFMDFLSDQRKHSAIPQAVKNKHLIVLRTLTKFFALPGLRIGYLIAHKELINKLRLAQPPWNVNALAQLAAEGMLNHKQYIQKTYKLIDKERDFLSQELGGFKELHVFPSVANFLLLKIEKPELTAASLKQLLLKKGILIRDCSNFRGLGEKFIRVAVRSREENIKLIAALRRVI